MSPLARNFLKFSSVPMRASFLPISAMPAFPTRITASRKGNGEYRVVGFANAELPKGYNPYYLHTTPFVKDWPLPRGKKFGFDDFFFSLICITKPDILYISTLW